MFNELEYQVARKMESMEIIIDGHVKDLGKRWHVKIKDYDQIEEHADCDTLHEAMTTSFALMGQIEAQIRLDLQNYVKDQAEKN